MSFAHTNVFMTSDVHIEFIDFVQLCVESLCLFGAKEQI